jgi:hypothetical protein
LVAAPTPETFEHILAWFQSYVFRTLTKCIYEYHIT